MAIGAILGDVPVFEDERPLLFHMATGTGLLGGTPLEQFVLCRSVGIMTVDAGHLFFP